MTEKVHFILGVHNHLPNGVAEEEFENLYNNQIRPLVSALYQFPRIHVVFHYSGVLYHWIERRHPELFVLLSDLLNRKQAELLGGGFYEPMMPLLPVADRIGQIEMQTTYLRRQFGRRPLGCWLPFNTWEQNLVVQLGACGMAFTFLDECCFAAAGAKLVQEHWYEPCITEDQGKLVTVFPVFSSLKSLKPMTILEKILNPRFTGRGPITVFPDFTFSQEQTPVKVETEYQVFFEELSAADPRIEFTTPSRLYKNLPGLEKLYFPGSCVKEQADISPHGSPRQFLTKYPEAGNIYAKMIHTRVLINQLRGDKARKQAALEELWKAQDSGIFSTGYLNNSRVRRAAYRALLEAENIMREKESFAPSAVFDYDLDGQDEYILQDEKLNCYIKAAGAGLFELDYLPAAWNVLDTFVLKKTGKCRTSFYDYLVPGKKEPALNWQGIEGARGAGAEIFQCTDIDRTRRVFQFRIGPQDGTVEKIPLKDVEIKKTWSLKRGITSLKYELKNTGAETGHFFLVTSIDFSFSGGEDGCVKIFALRESSREGISPGTQIENLNGLEFRDVKNEVVLALEASRVFTAGIFLVDPEQYQFTNVMPCFPVSLEPGKTWDVAFSLKFSS